MKSQTNLDQTRLHWLDVFRFLGCFSIVWFHSNLFGHLSNSERSLITALKSLLISWAMPYFYILSAYFSFKFDRDLTFKFRRYLVIFRLLVIWTLLALFFNYLLVINPSFPGIQFLIFFLKFSIILRRLVVRRLTTFITCNNKYFRSNIWFRLQKIA